MLNIEENNIPLVTKDRVLAYQIFKLRQRLLEDESDARKVLSIIQLWEYLSLSPRIRQDFKNLGLDVDVIKQYRNWLAHCCTFDYEQIDTILDFIKGKACIDYLLIQLSPVLDSVLKDAILTGNYSSIIGKQI